MAICGNVTLPYNAARAPKVNMSEVIGRMLVPSVCAFGVVGNILNLIILIKLKRKKAFRALEQSANLCLIWLAISDLMFCGLAGLTVLLPPDNIYDHNGFLLNFGVYNIAIINMFIMESTWLTVVMSLERYTAICFPLKQNLYITTGRLKFVIASTILFSVSFNIPVLWRNKVAVMCSSDALVFNKNLTLLGIRTINNELVSEESLHDLRGGNDALVINDCTNNSLKSSSADFAWKDSVTLSAISFVQSSFHSSSSLTSQEIKALSGRSITVQTTSIPPNSRTFYTTEIVPLLGSEVYDTAYRILWAFFGNFIPLVLLFYFNMCLCRKIYRSYKLRRRLGRQGQPRSSSHVMTITLVAIIALFFVLVAPSEVTLQIARVTHGNNSNTYKNIEAILNLMQSLNFSINFILYCVINPDFRKRVLFCHKCKIPEASHGWCKEFVPRLV